uniref:DNA topoisomerase I n=2 Tax=Chelydra serpentina TaxID=8475 RepID=A0A8C3T2H2_CHESE
MPWHLGSLHKNNIAAPVFNYVKCGGLEVNITQLGCLSLSPLSTVSCSSSTLLIRPCDLPCPPPLLHSPSIRLLLPFPCLLSRCLCHRGVGAHHHHCWILASPHPCEGGQYYPHCTDGDTEAQGGLSDLPKTILPSLVPSTPSPSLRGTLLELIHKPSAPNLFLRPISPTMPTGSSLTRFPLWPGLVVSRTEQRGIEDLSNASAETLPNHSWWFFSIRWEEEKTDDGVKWKQLEHKGPYFAPLYEPLPDDVKFYYDGKSMKLNVATEEIATFYAKMLDHEYTTKEIFQNNFFHDWRKEMTSEERKKIKHLEKCDFKEMHKYFVDKNEARKALPKEEKQKLKEEADKIQEEYGYCILDGHREKIGNFKTEPPGLFRGRGDHPKMGMLKKRIMPEDVIINCSKDSKTPEPPSGHKWKEVRCDNTVTWLASWTENIQNSIKYIMLNPSSKLKGEKDWQKYEVARRLKGVVSKIRSQYRADWKSREMKKRQRSVALYFIDKLALRAGNEKEEGETADTVGCCSLRVEHIKLHPELDGQEHVVEFDFLGKDSIRYYNKVPVEKPVFKNLQLFMESKDPGDDLFDRLNTTVLNKHLQDLMDGLTAKVFRTYNASITLQEQLKALTNAEDNVAAKLLSYNRANRAVAILCNHQRATPKSFEKSMQNLQAKIDAKKEQLAEAQMELKRAKADLKAKKDVKSKAAVEKKKKLLEKIEEQLLKLNVQATDKEENKQIALGTSKLNYLDPRISVAWCKKFGVPIEKIYNKTQREKFAWAIDMADEDFEF